MCDGVGSSASLAALNTSSVPSTRVLDQVSKQPCGSRSEGGDDVTGTSTLLCSSSQRWVQQQHSAYRSSVMKKEPSILCAMQCPWMCPRANAMQCHAMPCNAMQCHAMQCNAMQCHAMPMQCNAMQCNAMQCNQCNAMQCNAMQCNAM